MSGAISGVRRGMKELVDGTIRLTVDISPVDRVQFWALFPAIDMPIALAPLIADFEQKEDEEEPLRGGALCKLAAILCNDPQFQAWIMNLVAENRVPIKLPIPLPEPEEAAAISVRAVCGIASRRELDHDARAARIFNEKIRQPWLEYQGLT